MYDGGWFDCLKAVYQELKGNPDYRFFYIFARVEFAVNSGIQVLARFLCEEGTARYAYLNQKVISYYLRITISFCKKGFI